MPYFRAFSAFSVTATNFMNSITFVMNHLISYFDISICHCSNRTLCYHLFKFHGFNHGYFLEEPPIGKNHVPAKAIKARFYKEIHASNLKLIPVLEPKGIDHSESSRNNQSELIRNSQCTCFYIF